MNLRFLFGKLFKKYSRPEKADILIFGLGNPGSKYQKTRHNIGFRVIENLQARMSGGKSGVWGESEYISGMSGTITVVLVKPQTFVNQSGKAVGRWVRDLKMPLQKIVVIVDDFNLPLGSIRMRQDGSAGGHNGLKSVTEHIGADFPRLRIGTGPLPQGIEIIEFVLSEFGIDEEKKIGNSIEKAAEAVLLFMQKGAEAAMSKYNK
jgi:peptidyl-tRNA hydrolase, PTH1 family